MARTRRLVGAATKARLSAGERQRFSRVARILERTYGNPRLGNKKDPLDELIYIILSAKTTDTAFRRSYSRLHERFPDWFEISRSRSGTVARLIRASGLSRKKERQIRGLLRQLSVMGARTFRPHLRRLDDHEAERFLTSLPGVGLKTARCVLMYSLDRRVLPIDTHVDRVLSRLGFASGARLTERLQNEIQSRVPPELRYSLHVNLVAHGRSVCMAQRPACSECPIERLCPSSIVR